MYMTSTADLMNEIDRLRGGLAQTQKDRQAEHDLRVQLNNENGELRERVQRFQDREPLIDALVVEARHNSESDLNDASHKKALGDAIDAILNHEGESPPPQTAQLWFARREFLVEKIKSATNEQLPAAVLDLEVWEQENPPA